MVKITCVFRRTTEGRLALLFACDLLRLWQAPGQVDGNLHVFVGSGEADAKLIASADWSADQLLQNQHQRVLLEVMAATGLAESQIIISDSEAHGEEIIVDHASAFSRADLDVLYPSREKSLLARGKGPLLVPFGDSLSALPAAQIAISMAAAMTLPVVFYHTTWVDQAVTSANPADHMCEAARDVAQTLQTAASDAGVEHSLIVETADDVAEGILQCALRHSVRLIIMPRSAKTTMGCYVNQAMAKTPLPLLAVAAKTVRQTEGLSCK